MLVDWAPSMNFKKVDTLSPGSTSAKGQSRRFARLPYVAVN